MRRHGAIINHNPDSSTHNHNKDHNSHERIPRILVFHSYNPLYRHTSHLICQSDSLNHEVLHLLARELTYGKSDSRQNHMLGKLTTTVTSHRQQTSFPITSRVKPRCRTRTVSKRKQEQKNCREDGDSDIVVKVPGNKIRNKA
ncbi:hypothetical protein E4T44_13882 [Aureobasidium sp. EXF-8845]|nr:hypothetical protein E4T45_14251 [Aureobasidium sp. EXF-8846]KAI4786436.1 hypothetical protein E4T44_13882 [Aureobasidium sp. EXF-8845]